MYYLVNIYLLSINFFLTTYSQPSHGRFTICSRSIHNAFRIYSGSITFKIYSGSITFKIYSLSIYYHLSFYYPLLSICSLFTICFLSIFLKIYLLSVHNLFSTRLLSRQYLFTLCLLPF